MKILQIADMHIGKNLNEYSLLEEQKEVLNFIANIIEKQSVDIVCICGDIYDKAIPQLESISLFESFLNTIILDLKKKVIIISGNHDHNIRLSAYSNILRDTNLYISKNFEKELEKIEFGEVCFYLFPFTSYYTLKKNLNLDYNDYDSLLEYVLKNTKLDKNKYNVLLAHDYVANINTPIIESDSERRLYVGGSMVISPKLFDEFNLILLGHIHANQQVNEKIFYSGSIMKYSFSEVNHKKCALLHDTVTKTHEKIELPITKDLVIIKGKLEELIDENFYKKYNYKNDFFKAVITNKEEVVDAAIKLKNIYKNLLEITKDDFYTPNIVTNYKKLDLKENLTDFFLNMYDHTLSNEEKDILFKLLDKEGE